MILDLLIAALLALDVQQSTLPKHDYDLSCPHGEYTYRHHRPATTEEEGALCRLLEGGEL
jgi:hypothetical protein